ncbi:MAG: response regulator, partial [Candidatus Omnitrophota bacterium]
ILVVDDNRDFADSLVDILQLEGHRVSYVYTAEDALLKAFESPFDIIFIDLKLDNVYGTEIAKKISAKSPQTKIVIMTGFCEDEKLKEALAQGIDKILYKPFKINEILQIVKSFTIKDT